MSAYAFLRVLLWLVPIVGLLGGCALVNFTPDPASTDFPKEVYGRHIVEELGGIDSTDTQAFIGRVYWLPTSGAPPVYDQHSWVATAKPAESGASKATPEKPMKYSGVCEYKAALEVSALMQTLKLSGQTEGLYYYSLEDDEVATTTWKSEGLKEDDLRTKSKPWSPGAQLAVVTKALRTQVIMYQVEETEAAAVGSASISDDVISVNGSFYKKKSDSFEGHFVTARVEWVSLL